MFHVRKLLSLSALVAVGVSMAFTPSNAHKVKKTTHVKSLPTGDTVPIDFTAFDIDDDGIYSKAEVGTKLFDVFDKNGNELIGSEEFKHKGLYTVVPVEQETTTYVDYDEDGDYEQVRYEYDQFMTETRLTYFDDHEDGLSPSDFIEKGFYEIDTDNDKYIDQEEWEQSYLVSIGLPEDERLETYLNQ